jgi:hypothetical protein
MRATALRIERKTLTPSSGPRGMLAIPLDGVHGQASECPIRYSGADESGAGFFPAGVEPGRSPARRLFAITANLTQRSMPSMPQISPGTEAGATLSRLIRPSKPVRHRRAARTRGGCSPRCCHGSATVRTWRSWASCSLAREAKPASATASPGGMAEEVFMALEGGLPQRPIGHSGRTHRVVGAHRARASSTPSSPSPRLVSRKLTDRLPVSCAAASMVATSSNSSEGGALSARSRQVPRENPRASRTMTANGLYAIVPSGHRVDRR